MGKTVDAQGPVDVNVGRLVVEESEMTADEAAEEWIAEGVSITRVVLIGDEEAASRMVRNVFDANEFRDAIALVAKLEASRLNDKLERYCCEKGEALGLRGICCQECAAISDGYAAGL